MLSIWADQNTVRGAVAVRAIFFRLLLGTGVALIGWEVLQRWSQALVFDWHDIGATIAGLGLGLLLFNGVAGERSEEHSLKGP